MICCYKRFLENFNPRSLKEIATEKSVNINPVMNDDNTIVMTDETSINDTFPTEPMDHGMYKSKFNKLYYY